MRLLAIVFAAALAASVIADLVLSVAIPGFYAGFGFLGCIVIILGSKWLGKGFQRGEDCYGETEDG